MIIAGIILLLVIWALIERKLLVTTKYTITSERLPKKFDKTSFILLADLHNCTFGKNNERLIKRINLLNPEFIIVAGDMINKKEACFPSNAFTLLESLAKKYKIYYAYGNHEQRMELYGNAFVEDKNSKELYDNWIKFRKKLQERKVVFLDNASIDIMKNSSKLSITGVSIGPQYFKRGDIPKLEEEYLRSLIGKKDKQTYQILIAHNPMHFSEYAKWGADLTVSGHLHGGMVRLPGIGGVLSPQAKFFPKYHAGIYTKDNQQMIVSRGLGSHSIMPRLFNIPEIVSIELRCK
jgi:uncharacterized protein